MQPERGEQWVRQWNPRKSEMNLGFRKLAWSEQRWKPEGDQLEKQCAVISKEMHTLGPAFKIISMIMTDAVMQNETSGATLTGTYFESQFMV